MADYLLDTSIAVELRDGDPDLSARFAKLQGRALLSVVSRVELEGGVYRHREQASVRRIRLDALLDTTPVLDFTAREAEAYGRIVAVAGYSRRKLLDRMIAAQALVHRATLITRNGEDFQDVPGLSLLAW